MKSFIFIKIIILVSFFINVKAEQKNNVFDRDTKSVNPYLSESKELKEINFENLKELLIKNNQEYAAEI